MLFNIALNYGGRAEIVEAARRMLAAGVDAGRRSTRQRFAGFLYTAGQPDPDLLIRTSGEMRVSNFLLWQIAYAEIWVTDTLWPDFRKRAPARGDPRLSEARPPLRRHHSSRSVAGALMTRVLSALVLLPVVVGTVWFLPPVGDARPRRRSPPLLAFVEYARHRRGARRRRSRALIAGVRGGRPRASPSAASTVPLDAGAAERA